jgi:magnesium transporter
MIVRAFEIDEALRLTPVTPERIEETARRPDARLWIDLVDITPGELQEWLNKLSIEGFGRRLCLEAGDRPGFYPLKNLIFFVIPALVGTPDTGELDHVGFLCTEKVLLTTHRSAIFDSEKLRKLDASDAWLPGRSIAGLVSALLIDQSLECLRKTKRLRDSVDALEDHMDREPDAVEAEEILGGRVELVTLGSLVSDQLPVVQAMSRLDRPSFRLADARDYMGCVLANLQAADGSLTWLDQRFGSLRAAFQMHAQDKTNRRLNMLTVLSAIFMPVTLLAGIWGMNFALMPELQYRFAYPVALGLMAAVGFGMYRFFRRTGWLD